MEDLDIASDRAELERETIMRRIMQRQPNRPMPNGECHECGELVTGYRIYCDGDCADAAAKRPANRHRPA